MSSQLSVALIGKLGHGKTYVLNKVCGTHHASSGGCRSVTRTIEVGYSKKHGIALVGTPGLCPTEDVLRHIGAQKSALEYTPLSGVYVVIKCSRDGDMLDDRIFDIIDMVGEESVRIIITHADIEAAKEGFDGDDVKRRVAKLAGIRCEYVALVGLHTPSGEIEDFIHSTLLPSPRQIQLQTQEVTKLASQSHQSRTASKMIRDIYTKIDAAEQYCTDLISDSTISGHEKDVEIMDIQQAMTSIVRDEKEAVFRLAVTDLSLDEQNICFAQAGASLSIRLKHFVESTNRLLSWKVSDVNDPRNQYRSCNYCGAVFVKVEGCDGATTCGNIPSVRDDWTGGLEVYFGFNFDLFGGKWRIIRKKLRRTYRAARSSGAGGVHRKLDGSLIESGCGNTIEWSSMRPIEPSLVEQLGRVEELKAGTLEEISGHRFHADIKIHEVINNDMMRKCFDEAHTKQNDASAEEC